MTTEPTDEIQFIAGALRSEAGAIERLASGLDRPEAADNWRQAVDLLTACCGHVVLSGMGKSGLVGAKISATFSSLGQPSNVLHPAEAVHGDLGRVRRGDAVILLSYSGETAEVVDLALILKADDVPTLGVSVSGETSLARATTVHLAVGDLTEACPLNLAPTASTTAQLAIGDALALAVARRRQFSADDFHRSHPGGLLGAALRPVIEVLRFKVGHNLAVVNQDLPVRAALAEAGGAGGTRRAGALLVVDDAGRLAGIFTDGDLRRLVLEDPAALDRSTRDVMTVDPHRLETTALVRDAERMVREYRLDEIPVVDAEGRPAGVIDIQDLVTLKLVKDSDHSSD